MFIGADYYPEHWPRERWAADAELMKNAGFNVTRLAEFSWIKLEPTEGCFDFAWLDEAVETLGRHGISSILCTPTAAMPKWACEKYPEIAAVDKNGHPMPFGNRQHNCFTSASYRRLSERVTRALAEHYRDNPYVIGWQLDNELWGPNCYCPACENAFRDSLRMKFGTIEALNEAYGTIFWSHCCRDFSETHLPRHEHSNPSLHLDYMRFHSANIISFAKEQADILRALCPNHFITHNLMGFSESVDYYELSKLLDFASFDYYYNLGPKNTWENRAESCAYGSASLDVTRSFKHKGFWIMENTAGATGWSTYGRNVMPGEIRRMSLQNLARGAEGQVWFRWRTCRFGTEQYWHGILGHDGLPGRRYHECAQTAKDLHILCEAVKDAPVSAPVAFVMDFEDRWALSQQPNGHDFNYIRTLLLPYYELLKKGVSVEFVSPSDDLSGYKAVFCQTKYILPQDFAASLERYVRAGGILVTGYRTGVKNKDNVPYDMTLPGFLRECAGLRVEEYEGLPKASPYGLDFQGEPMEGAVLCDWIIPETAKPLASFSHPLLSGFAAAAVNEYGAGKVYYLGIESEALVRRIAGLVLADAGIHACDLPSGVELVTRKNPEAEFLFILNHSDNPYPSPVCGANVLTGGMVRTGDAIAAHDAVVLKIEGTYPHIS